MACLYLSKAIRSRKSNRREEKKTKINGKIIEMENRKNREKPMKPEVRSLKKLMNFHWADKK